MRAAAQKSELRNQALSGMEDLVNMHEKGKLRKHHLVSRAILLATLMVSLSFSSVALATVTVPDDGEIWNMVNWDIQQDEKDQLGWVAKGPTALSIKLKSAPCHTVSFVAYYVDSNCVIERSDGIPITATEAQQIADYRTVTEPPSFEGQVDRIFIGWAETNPETLDVINETAFSDAVDFATRKIGEATTFYALLKSRDYSIRLDANNGSADCGGTVAEPGQIAVPRNSDYDNDPNGKEPPAGISYADIPVATRPGYVFKGWYWPKTQDGTPEGPVVTDSYGRAVLREDGLAAPAEGTPGFDPDSEMSYVDIRANSGRTLYAKWEVAPSIKLNLTDALDAEGKWGISLWYWPNRGYTVERPANDLELREGASIYGSTGDKVVELSSMIAHNPIPGSSQYFRGWGYQAQSGGELKEAFLLRCAKDEEGGYSYALSNKAFAEPFVSDGAWVCPSADLGEDGFDGWKKLDLTVISGAARISVSAPFEVTFQKSGDGGATSAYSPDELEWTAEDAAAGRSEWIASEPFDFTNTGDTDVYVSGVECLDVGASAILPGGSAGEKIFSLYEKAGYPAGADGIAEKQAIPFGYTAVGHSNKVTVSALDEDKWITLPLKQAGESFSKQLYYGLHVSKAAFNRAAIAIGNPSGGAGGTGNPDNSYIAKVANVKYTYSVIP